MLNILIADSDPIRKKIYRQAFESNKEISYNLTETYTNLEEQLKNKKSDISVIYLHTITQNEIDFLCRIKLQKPDTSIILITKPNNSREIFRRSEAEIDNYFFTPFSADDLITTIRNII